MYGKDWKEMIPLIKIRSQRQIRTHAQKVLKSMYAKSKDSKTPHPMEVGDNFCADSSANSEDDVNFEMEH